MTNAACVYQIINTDNGMRYIGVTKNPKQRFIQHASHAVPTKSAIKNAIKKYGKEKFDMQILFYADQSYCYEMEAKLILAYKTLSPNGYNICSGGKGAVGLFGEVNGMFGRRGEAHPHFGKVGYNLGKKLSQETRSKMSASRTGKTRSAEHREKLRQIALNRSPELLQKMRDARMATVLRKNNKEQS